MLQAVQYMLRRITLASCFCLVCHRRTAEDLEAIRPFICESPLCTYQYLQIGLGPSIELELLHNRTVVDMLISFAYIGAANYAGSGSPMSQRYRAAAPPLEPFPYGVGYADIKEITSPASNIKRVLRKRNANPEPQFNYYGRTFKPKVASVGQGSHMILEAPVAFESPRVNSGTKIPFTILREQYVGWPVDKPTDPASLMEDHKLFTDTSDKMPCVDVMAKVLERIRRGSVSMDDKPAQQLDTPPPEPPTHDQMNVKSKVDPYADPFENLDPKMFLVQTTRLNLRPFLDTVDKLLYSLLRWIICSNRSYLRELVDPREQIVGMETKYVQFKTVMGSYDKETRFMREREKECPTSQGKVQSLWALLTNSLPTWHEILRGGLKGGVYGQGLYHSFEEPHSSFDGKAWPKSKLHMGVCMCLNEIVNQPSKFQAITDSHLVLDNVCMVQPRFLIIRPPKASPTKPAYQTSSTKPEALIGEASKPSTPALENPFSRPPPAAASYGPLFARATSSVFSQIPAPQPRTSLLTTTSSSTNKRPPQLIPHTQKTLPQAGTAYFVHSLDYPLGGGRIKVPVSGGAASVVGLPKERSEGRGLRVRDRNLRQDWGWDDVDYEDGGGKVLNDGEDESEGEGEDGDSDRDGAWEEE
ncbi:hypothetical protein HDV00_006094 [Rhizophlyctis rosea]|nr:hypothetical protein HDV00_006094 [Rhizophlyctis rosea]